MFDDVLSGVKDFGRGVMNSAINMVDQGLDYAIPFYNAGDGSDGRRKEMYKYPLTLGDDQHTSRLVFTATNAISGDSKNQGRDKIFGNYKELSYSSIGSVFMYMPRLSQAYMQNYSEDGRGLMWQLVNAFQSGGGFDNPSGAIQSTVQTGAAAAIQGLAPTMLRDFSQIIKNQHLSAHFTGTALRTQKFDFDLRPRNMAELQQIAGLLKFFKMNAASTFHDGDTQFVPSRWVIEEMTVGDRVISPFRFGPAYLTGIEIDYTPDDSWKTFENGDPISMKLTLEFIEIAVVSRDDIRDNGL